MSRFIGDQQYGPQNKLIGKDYEGPPISTPK